MKVFIILGSSLRGRYSIVHEARWKELSRNSLNPEGGEEMRGEGGPGKR